MPEIICCPTCHSPLQVPEEATASACKTCGREFRLQQGILDFLPGDPFYWGEVDKKVMVSINDQGEREGWFKAFHDHLGQDFNLMRYLFDPIRIGAIFHCYDGSRRERCLDLGSGWGPISFGLGRLYRKVYSLDGVYERLRFQSIRAHQDGVDNLRPIRSRMLELPFLNDCMDLVIVNGLLEWVALNEPDTPPGEVQIRFLKEVLRVLRPGGRVLIGIENRFGAQYLRGGRDHSGIRFTSLVPRWLADIMVRITRRSKESLVFSGAEKKYRTLTHSYQGYRTLLKKCGFTLPEIFWTYPGYNYPHVSGLPDGWSLRKYLDLLIEGSMDPLQGFTFKAIRKLPVACLAFATKAFSPCFLIVASKDPGGERLQENLTKEATSSSFLRISTDVRPELKTTFLLLDHNRISHVKQVRLRRQVPGMFDDFQVSEQQAYTGTHLRYGDPIGLEMATRWLVEFQQSTRQGTWSQQELMDELNSLVSRLRTLCDETTNAILDQYKVLYRDFISHGDVPHVTEHGDFTFTNLLQKDGRILPIDWEYKRDSGHPFMDAGGLCLDLLTARGKQAHRGNRLLTNFVNVYEKNAGMVINLSPVYYLLRILARTIDQFGTDPVVMLYVQKWIARLPMAMDFAIAGENGSTLAVNGGLP